MNLEIRPCLKNQEFCSKSTGLQQQQGKKRYGKSFCLEKFHYTLLKYHLLSLVLSRIERKYFHALENPLLFLHNSNHIQLGKKRASGNFSLALILLLEYQFCLYNVLHLRFQRVYQPHPAHEITGLQFLGDARRINLFYADNFCSAFHMAAYFPPLASNSS